MTRYKVDTYGKTYYSNGMNPCGWKGQIGGLSAEYVIKQIESHKKTGESLVITRESDGIMVNPENFLAGMR